MRVVASNAPAESAARARGLIAGAALVAATLAAYANSFHGPFVFDDLASIANNPTISQLWPPWTALRPPGGGITVAGRPLLNLSFALNYAFTGSAVAGFHVANLAIHLLAGLTLFGILRRVAGPEGFGTAFAGALLWLLHPLQTESVTYVVQRAESLMGLCYLATVYFFLRYATSAARGTIWAAGCIVACACGMACKEVAASAPVVVFLFDRTFCSGSFGQAWQRHGRVHGMLAATWSVLAILIATGADRGATAGPGLGLHAAAVYALAQFPALVRYAELAVWPQPLVFDYGTGWENIDWRALPCALVVLAALVATVIALWWRPVAGFFGAWFFLILAPSSSVIPIATERMAEHRMYLPLAAVVVGLVVLLHRGVGRRGRLVVVGVAAALACGLATAARNRTYGTELALWSDTVAKRPQNAFARINLGHAFFSLGRFSDAVVEDDAALALEPAEPKAWNNRGRARAALGRMAEARADFEAALRLKPDYAEAHNNLGVLDALAGNRAAALIHFRTALRLSPNYPEAHANLTRALALRP